MNTSSSNIELSQVSVRKGKRDILRSISLFVSEPLTFILGLNGSGKTTLLRAIAGEMAYQGQISINGTDLQNLSPRQKARQMAVVHQRMNLPFQLKVADFVLMGRFAYLGWLGTYSLEDKERSAREMKRMGVWEFRDRFLQQISGGEMQKVLIARALCQATPWILMDEPAQQLDPRNREQFYKLVHGLAEQGLKVLCTTHDREALAGQEARLIGIKNGEIVLDDDNGLSWDRIMKEVY